MSTNNQRMYKKIAISETIIKSESYTTDSTDLTLPIANTGKFSLQIAITGDGTAKVEYLLSNDNVTFITPTGVSEIATGLTKTTNATGNDMYSFTPMLSKYIKLKVTETGTSDSVIINAILVTQ